MEEHGACPTRFLIRVSAIEEKQEKKEDSYIIGQLSSCGHTGAFTLAASTLETAPLENHRYLNNEP